MGDAACLLAGVPGSLCLVSLASQTIPEVAVSSHPQKKERIPVTLWHCLGGTQGNAFLP